MAMVQLTCPETGKPLDLADVSPAVALLPRTLEIHVEEIPCPHCGEHHSWSSMQWGAAMNALRDSPDATRVLVDGGSVRALP